MGSKRFSTLGLAICCWFMTGCHALWTQYDYARDLLPESVEMRVVPVSTQSTFPEDLAHSYLARKINATRYGVALNNTATRSKQIFAYSEMYVTVFEQKTVKMGTDEVLYFLVVFMLHKRLFSRNFSIIA